MGERVEMFPIFLKLEGRRYLVVGAGTIATPKIASLLRAGAEVTVVAPEAGDEARRMAGEGAIAWRGREFTESDLDGVFLVVTGTDQQEVNHRVARAARERNILVNSVDDPPDCDFYYPSLVRRGDLQIAISTAGKSPALAQRLREEIDALLEPELGDWLDELGATRLRMLEVYELSDERKRALHLLARRETCEPATCPVQQELNKLLTKKGEEAAKG